MSVKRDPETNELPAQAGREPTLPLPREGDGPVERRRRRPFGDLLDGHRPWLAVAAAAAIAAGSFALGWTLGDGPPSQARDRPAAVGPAPPTADALYCGRALDVAAQMIETYRNAMENRVAFVDAVLEDDVERMARLDARLPLFTHRVERLETRVTSALAVCPS